MGTIGGKMGCGAALVAGFLVSAPLMFLNFYGDCAGEPACNDGEGLRFLMVACITAAVAAAAGFGVRALVNSVAGHGE